MHPLLLRPILSLALALPLSMANAQFLSRTHTVFIDPSEVPYLVRLALPAGSTPVKISDAGHFDAINNQILWGPFSQSDDREVSFDLVSENLAAVSQTAEVVTTSGTAAGSVPTVAPGNRSYASWVQSSALVSPSGIDLASSFDPDNDGLPNAIEYLLDLNPAKGSDLWQTITISENGSGRLLQFPAQTSPDWQLFLEVLDLDGDGEFTQTIELTSGNETIDQLGERFFFRLSAVPKK